MILWPAWLSLALAGGEQPLTGRMEYHSRTWKLRDGLPQVSVLDLAQDRDGYLWLVTFGGISRFDGNQFTNLDISSYPELGTNRMQEVEQDPSGVLWFSTEHQGLLRWTGEGFESVSLPEGLTNTMNSLRFDAQGTLWANAGMGRVLRVSDGVSSLVEVEGDWSSLSRLDSYSDGTIWLLDETKQLCLTGPCQELLQVQPRSESLARWALESGLNNQHILWSSEWEPPAACREEAEALVEVPWYRVFQWSGHDWCILPTGLVSGAQRIDNAAMATYRTLFVGREGELWIGAIGKGLLHIRSSGIEKFEPSSAAYVSVYDLQSGPDGRVWGRANQHLFTIFDDDLDALPEALQPYRSKVSSMAMAADGTLWLKPTAGEMLIQYRDDEVETVRSPLGEGERGKLLVDDLGQVWMIGTQRVMRLGDEGPVETLQTEEVGGYVNVIRHGQDGARWFGHSMGVSSQHQEGWTHLSREDGVPLGELRDLMIEPDGTVWIGTYGGGLGHLKDGRIRLVTSNEGLCENVVSRFLMGDDGDLWLHGNRGLSRVEIEDLRAVATGRQRRLWCDLVDSGEVNSNSGFIDKQGRFWLPTVSGVSRVDLSQQEAPVLPRAQIESALLDGRPIRSGDVAPPGPGGLEVHFTGLGLREPEALRFRYRLIGHDSAWIESGVVRTIRYSRLSPQSYRFEVQVRGRRGEWSPPVSISFSLQPYIYQRTSVQVAVLMLLLALLLGSFRMRIRALTRQAEDRLALQRQLQQAQKLEALGQLAGGVAHDFNNLLTIIGTNLEFLRPSVSEPELVDDIDEAVRRAVSLVRKMLIFAREDVSQEKLLCLPDSIDNALEMLRVLLPETITLGIDHDSSSTWVRIDPVSLERVLMNLMVNAREALSSGGHIQVSTGQERVEAAFAQKHSIESGSYAVIAVQDNGPGIPAELQSRIFEPFFTTRAVGQGTGLGLSTSMGAIQEAGGCMELSSPSGRGACFRVYLPLVEGPKPVPSANPLERTPRGVGERIVVCDDEPALLDLMVRILEKYGYQALATQDPEHALSLIPDAAMLITDVVMPGISGPVLAARARELRPELPVLYVSGHTQDLLDIHGMSHDAVVLAKPFTAERLKKQIDAMLRGAPPHSSPI